MQLETLFIVLSYPCRFDVGKKPRHLDRISVKNFFWHVFSRVENEFNEIKATVDLKYSKEAFINLLSSFGVSLVLL